MGDMLTITGIIFAVFLLIFLGVACFDLLKNKKDVNKYHLKDAIVGYLMILPAAILTFLFVLLPILYSLGYAFTDYYFLKPNDINFVGFKNFEYIINNIMKKGDIYHAIKNTAIFVVLVVPLQIGLALGLALFCNSKRKGVTIFKVCFFAPIVISLTVTSYLWEVILSSSETGLLNSILGMFGIPAQDFLGNKDTTMIWIVIISAWQGCGFQMLIFLSALSGTRKDLYEAASLDGANAFNRFVHVTIPSIRPTMLYILITVFIGACRIMVQPMLLVGYQDNSVTLSYYMYQTGYVSRQVGLSSAVALLMTIIIGSVTFIQRKFLGEKK